MSPGNQYYNHPGHCRIGHMNTTLIIEFVETKAGVKYRLLKVPDQGLCTVYEFDDSNINHEVAVGLFNIWASKFDKEEHPRHAHEILATPLGSKPIINFKAYTACPLCNSEMIEREGKYGKFWACSSWSQTKCPGILNAQKQPNKKTLSLMKKPQATSGPPSATEDQKKKIEFEAINMLDI